MVAFQIFGVVSGVLIARTFQAAGQGRYQLFMSIGFLAVILARLGLGEAVSYLVPRFLATRPESVRALIKHAMSRAILSSLLVGLSVFLLADLLDHYLIPSLDFAHELRLELVLIPVLMVFTMANSILSGLGRSDIRAFVFYYLTGGGFVVATFLIFLVNSPLDHLYWARIAVFALGSAAGLWMIERLTPGFSSRLESAERREVWSFGGLMVLTAASEYVITQPIVDLVVVGNVAGVAMMGIYAVAAKLASLLILASDAFTIVLGPALSRSMALAESEPVARNYKLAAKWMTLSNILFAGVFVIAGREALGIFGPEFVAGYPILLILVGFRAVQGLLGPNTPLLIASGHLRHQFVLTLGGAVVFTILVAVMGRVFGVLGVAIASGFSILAVEVARKLICRQYCPMVHLPERQVQTCLLAGLSLAASLTVKSQIDHQVIGSFVACSLFAAVFLIANQFVGVRLKLKDLSR